VLQRIADLVRKLAVGRGVDRLAAFAGASGVTCVA
jgi:hypothetical protein